jgi:hypothetical protein
MTLTNIIAEVQTELAQYDSAGRLDEISLRNWAKRALKGFGNLVTTLNEKTIEVKNGKVKLPQDFYSLYLAAKCEPYKVDIIKGCEDDLVDTFFYRFRTEQLREFDNQSGKFQNGEYKEVTEKIYLRGGATEVDVYFRKPTLLKVTRAISKEQCHPNCKNLSKALTHSSSHEINILGDYIQTNFSDGFIYIQYFALETDEQGDIIIPELSNDQLSEYIMYHLKRKALESVWIVDDEAVQGKIQWMLQMENDARLKAMSAAKIESISGYGWWETIRKRNRLRNDIFNNFTYN